MRSVEVRRRSVEIRKRGNEKLREGNEKLREKGRERERRESVDNGGCLLAVSLFFNLLAHES